MQSCFVTKQQQFDFYRSCFWYFCQQIY